MWWGVRTAQVCGVHAWIRIYIKIFGVWKSCEVCEKVVKCVKKLWSVWKSLVCEKVVKCLGYPRTPEKFFPNCVTDNSEKYFGVKWNIKKEWNKCGQCETGVDDSAMVQIGELYGRRLRRWKRWKRRKWRRKCGRRCERCEHCENVINGESVCE